MQLRLGERTLPIEPGRPLIMGIVNTSPDSVADKVRLRTLEEQRAAALEMRSEGAAIIDVGGDSGRTDRAPRPVEEEIRAVVPLVESLAAEGIAVSLDTFKLPVAEAAVAAGAALINDVSGLADPAMADLAAESGAGLVIMHTRSAPKAAGFPRYEDPVADVLDFLSERVRVALERGVRPEQIVLDPGPDFAKTPRDSIEILRRLPEIVALGRPVLLAVSRKYFIGALTDRPPDDRLAGTLAAVGAGVDAGAAILRVHDVSNVARFLRVRAVLLGLDDTIPDYRDEERLKWLPAS
jgi:dihydropteroate synthase